MQRQGLVSGKDISLHREREVFGKQRHQQYKVGLFDHAITLHPVKAHDFVAGRIIGFQEGRRFKAFELLVLQKEITVQVI